MEVDLQIVIRNGDKRFLDPAGIALLKLVQSNGSLNAAAKALNISYQNAWTIINDMNKQAPESVVVMQRGGMGGGGAILSNYGSRLLKEYDWIEQQVVKFRRQLNNEIHY